MSKQTRPFRALITKTDKENAAKLAFENACDYGWFFSTSGKLCFERINPDAQYQYVWRTDREVPK